MSELKEDKITIKVGEDEITFSTGKIGRQANGAVVVTCGDTMLFNTACAQSEASAEIDFIPLRVDYQEKFSSAGKTISGFIKREGRPSEREILTSRLIDRPIRPMFENGYFSETQLLSYVWSYDGVHNPEPLAICGVSAALVLSDIPLIKPIGAVRVGRIGDKFIINPSREQLESSTLDLLMAGTEDAVLMIEGYCDFLTEEQVIEAIEFGHKSIKVICHALAEWRLRIGKEKNRSALRPLPEDVIAAVEAIAGPKLPQAVRIAEKQVREEALGEIKQAVFDQLCPEDGTEPKFPPTDVKMAYKKVQANHMRSMVLQEKTRSDGRKPTDVRPITIEQSLLPRTHGSSLFTRGETQAVATCTLGGSTMAQRYEDLHGEDARHFYLQYFFPPFSVGEVGRMGPPGRREVGHGKLAERALQAVVPGKDKFPYTIRLESNITESNGSSSMATVCGGCLALMDAGVPVLKPVSGIAMGLILEGDDYTVLSDILGIEDALGDMDFKITGDGEGITAFQMDIKIEGITPEIMRAALMQARDGRTHILQKMLEVCPKTSETMSEFAPRIETMQVNASKIATIIGPGGKQIRAIIDETGVQIDIDDTGLISITSPDAASIEKAKAIINGLTAEVEIGRTYEGKVKTIVPFGMFVEVLPGKEGLCHISEFAHERTETLDGLVKEGDIVPVKVIDINERGQLKLSRKATLAKA